MAEGRFRAPRIRMPRVSLPTRSRRAAAAADTEARTTTQPASPANPGSTPTEPAKPAATKTAAGSKPPEPNLQERMEGLQGWMAELERKQARTTYFGALALLLAIAAAGAALYFGLTTRSDSAKKSDLDPLSKRIDSLEGAVTKNSKDTQNALNASIAQLQQSISSLQKQRAQDAANISTLQSQVAAGALGKGAANAGTTSTATTPGATKKP